MFCQAHIDGNASISITISPTCLGDAFHAANVNVSNSFEYENSWYNVLVIGPFLIPYVNSTSQTKMPRFISNPLSLYFICISNNNNASHIHTTLIIQTITQVQTNLSTQNGDCPTSLFNGLPWQNDASTATSYDFDAPLHYELREAFHIRRQQHETPR